jgi:hypothetical protein
VEARCDVVDLWVILVVVIVSWIEEGRGLSPQKGQNPTALPNPDGGEYYLLAIHNITLSNKCVCDSKKLPPIPGITQSEPAILRLDSY